MYIENNGKLSLDDYSIEFLINQRLNTTCHIFFFSDISDKFFHIHS